METTTSDLTLYKVFKDLKQEYYCELDNKQLAKLTNLSINQVKISLIRLRKLKYINFNSIHYGNKQFQEVYNVKR